MSYSILGVHSFLLYHVLFCTYPPADVHLDDFCFGAVMNNAVMNIPIHFLVQIYVLIALKYKILRIRKRMCVKKKMLRSKTAGSYGKSMITILRKC